MIVEKRTMGWFSKPSAWEYSQNLAARRRAQAQSYINDQSSLAAAIFTASATASAGQTDLTMKLTIARLRGGKVA